LLERNRAAALIQSVFLNKLIRFFQEHTRLKNTLLSILSGVLMGLSYPPFKTWYLIYPSLLIFLYLILSSKQLKQTFGRGYLSLVVCSEITLYWISGWHSNDTFLKLAGIATVLVHPLFMMLPVIITYGIYKTFNKYTALFAFPLIWVGYEYFDNNWQFSFPWLELGNTETYNLWRIQHAEIIGVHGLTFLICLVTVLIFFSAERIYNRKWKLTGIKTILLLALIFIILFFPNYYSSVRLADKTNEKYFYTSDSTKIIKSCIAQTNTDPYKKWGGSQDTLIDSYIEKLDEGLKFNADLMLLHETAPPFYFLEDYNFDKAAKFFHFVNINKKYLLMGIPHLEYYADSNAAPNDARYSKSSNRKYDAFNSAILIEPNKNQDELTIHKKVKLVPFSERVPYQEIFPFAEKLINWGVGISHWQKGPGLKLFELNNSLFIPRAKFETMICFESVFSEYVSTGVKNGAEFIAVVTNDGWWGNTAGPYQHEQYAVLRAIENRKWLLRCAQTGVSCYIDPLGNIYDEIPYYSEGVISKNIIANNEITFYAKNGDLTGLAGFCIFLASFGVCLVNYVYIKISKRKA
jgi:apolipoprotein N-acyltransferase